jgi:hypothetical protein
MVTRQLYPSGTSYTQAQTSTSSREIDLRWEFDQIVYGGETSIPHGRKLLLRTVRRDSDGKKVPCTCVDSLTQEPDTESSCNYCLGEGAYWDEDWLIGFSRYVGADGGLTNRAKYLFPGPIRVDFRIFYLRYDTEITYDDKIVELQLDTEGDPVVPYKRETIYKPQTIVKYRSDRGRLEYIAVYCREEDALRPE